MSRRYKITAQLRLYEHRCGTARTFLGSDTFIKRECLLHVEISGTCALYRFTCVGTLSRACDLKKRAQKARTFTYTTAHIEHTLCLARVPSYTRVSSAALVDRRKYQRGVSLVALSRHASKISKIMISWNHCSSWTCVDCTTVCGHTQRVWSGAEVCWDSYQNPEFRLIHAQCRDHVILGFRGMELELQNCGTSKAEGQCFIWGRPHSSPPAPRLHSRKFRGLGSPTLARNLGEFLVPMSNILGVFQGFAPLPKPPY